MHAPLVAKHAEVLRIRRYVQCHALTTPFNDAIRASRGAPEMYDGVAELWWDSLDDLLALRRRPRRGARAAGRRAQVHRSRALAAVARGEKEIVGSVI